MKYLLAACLLFFLTLYTTTVYRYFQETVHTEFHNVTGQGHPPLHGRFLHITDIHADSHYKANKKIGSSCHHGPGRSGYLGTPGSDCDSPFSLVNATFDWIEKNLKDTIDFVVWTGDAVRHDRDDRMPRAEQEVIDLNTLVANKMINTFSTPKDDHQKSRTIPIVPTIGNNDIMPHNIFEKGPNKWTKIFGQAWHDFIPEEQRHSFAQGGWYYVEVVPDKLAVISLNTMYFYNSNSAVDGCNAKSGPGYAHMEWLRTHLQFLRDRGMKAILIGHVPPVMAKAKRSWYRSCWQKYTLWTRQYRDVIVGSVYGHMNIDHFVLQDFNEITIGQQSEKRHDAETDGTISVRSSTSSRFKYLYDLLKEWKDLPSPPSKSVHPTESDETWQDQEIQKSMDKYLEEIGGQWGERYAISLVSPSVIPCYFPSMRVIEYNITGLENAKTWSHQPSEIQSDYDLEGAFMDSEDDDELAREDVEASKKKKKKNKKKKKKKKKKFPIPKPPPKKAGPGPAYHNQAFTWLGYTQYFANITKYNDKSSSSDTSGPWKIPRNTWRDYQVKNSQEVSAEGANAFKYEVEYDTRTDPIYKLKDMTINSYLDLARRIAASSSKLKNEQSTTDAGLENHDRESHEPPSNSNKNQQAMGIKPDGSPKTSSDSFTDTSINLWKTFIQRAFVGFVDIEDLLAG